MSAGEGRERTPGDARAAFDELEEKVSADPDPDGDEGSDPETDVVDKVPGSGEPPD